MVTNQITKYITTVAEFLVVKNFRLIPFKIFFIINPKVREKAVISLSFPSPSQRMLTWSAPLSRVSTGGPVVKSSPGSSSSRSSRVSWEAAAVAGLA